MTAPKPVKTERTHEENQERAYIAASRRSDRSLEARVESARRASEIHKRRTGRSLRVTEQDVVNEEMYEEEDDDLPMQYRRLTAHLQTSNADFDRRLAAYLTNHVAMRTALGQAVSGINQQQQPYPNAAQFADQSQQFQQNNFMFTNPNNSMMPPQNQSPSMQRQSPFPQSSQAFRNMHNRSASIASPNEIHHGYSNTFAQQQTSAEGMKMEDRRMSLPVQGMPQTPVNQFQMAPQSQQTPQPLPTPSSVSPAASRTSSSSNLANLKFEAAQQGYFNKNQQRSPTSTSVQPQQMQASTFPSAFNTSGGFDMSGAGNPFSTTLPMESQQLLGGSFDPNDPMTSMLMGGDSHPFYSYNPSNPNGTSSKNFTSTSGAEGMNATLAPGMLDTNVSQFGFPGPQSASTDSVLSPWNGFGMGFGNQFGDPFKTGFSASGHTSGQVTPSADQDWSQLIDGNLWEEPSSQPTAA